MTEFGRESGIHEVETVAQLNKSADNAWIVGILLLRPLEGAVEAVFPEINTFAEPVVVVGAFSKGITCGIEQNAFGHVAIASVVADDRAIVLQVGAPKVMLPSMLLD